MIPYYDEESTLMYIHRYMYCTLLCRNPDRVACRCFVCLVDESTHGEKVSLFVLFKEIVSYSLSVPTSQDSKNKKLFILGMD